MQNRRAPFQEGSQLARINHVNILKTNIGTDAALATVKTVVSSFYTQLNTIYNTQKGKISQTSSGSSTVEAARIAMCTLQYGNLGGIIQLYAATPDKATAYFDLENIRSAHQVIFKRTVPPDNTAFVVEHTFHAGDKLELKNTGNTELHFYLGNSKTARPDVVFVTLPATESLVIDADMLGTLDNTFLCVYNLNRLIDGNCEVDLEV